MKKGKKLYEGKAKILYAAPEKGTAIQHFKYLLKNLEIQLMKNL